MKQKSMKIFLIVVSGFLLIISGCKDDSRDVGDYPIRPVPFTSVTMNDSFWAPRIRKNHEVTIPIAIDQSERTGRIRNFEIAGGLAEGDFASEYPFDDSDVFKIIEGASYSLQTIPDRHLEEYLDSLIYKIARAQEEDGYLYTYRTIMGDGSHEWIGDSRWEKTHILSHELYNLGHMMEAAVAHYQATGKKAFLDVAVRAANLVVNDFGWGKIENYPGHQEIEMGLVKLYRVTGEKRYLDLAKFFLDVRGPGGEEYNQAHRKVTDQSEAVGHAVRACYMYSGMADIAALYNDTSYMAALDRIWEDVVHRKIYVTGGIGATGGNEGFGSPYDLPNMTAYCETCASIANVFWNYRMFLHHGEAKYLDVLERTLYNALLSGVSLSGDLFFYPNPLESEGQHKRSPWFGCACCPSNISRFIPSLPGYLYATAPGSLYVNLYASSTATVDVDGKEIKVVQETGFPWEGKVVLILEPETMQRFTLRLRIPGWAREEAIPGDLYRFTNPLKENIQLTLNGEEIPVDIQNGYLALEKEWKSGDRLELSLPMEVRIIRADERVEADRNRIAIQRGPLVYCAEWPDQPDGKVLDLMFLPGSEFRVFREPDLLGGIRIVEGQAVSLENAKETGKGKNNIQKVTLIPYHLWNNRGPGEMRVWFPVAEEK